MRCIFGLVLCVVLCYVGLQAVHVAATATAIANNPGISQRAAQAAGWKVAEKYHAVVYAVAGLMTVALLSLPNLLARQTGFNEAAEWRRISKSMRT